VAEATKKVPVPPEEEDNLEVLRRSIERLRAVSFLPAGHPRKAPPIEWHPDPLVQLRQAIERLRAIKFR